MNTPNSQHQTKSTNDSLNSGFWRLWVVVSALSGAIGSVAGIYPGIFAGEIVAIDLLQLVGPGNGFFIPDYSWLGWIVFHGMYGFVSGTIFGVAVGGAQGIVLRKRLSRARLWTVASASGCAIGGTLSGAVIRIIDRFPLPFWYITLGAMVGLVIAQWFAFRMRTPHALSWVLSSAASLVISVAFSYGVVFCFGAEFLGC